jgi:AcrR family transcriptional regulator
VTKRLLTMASMSDSVNAPDARSRLLDAAVRAFAARGFHGTTTRDIASAAGMSPAALYVHHRSKEELLHQISLAGHEHALALCEAAVGDTEDPRTQLVRLVRDFVRHHALNHTVGRIVNYELAGLTPEHRAQIDVMRRRMDAIVRDLVLRGVEAGAFHTPEPAMTGAAILSLGIDVSRWFDHERGWNPDQVAEHYCELVLRMVGDSGSSPG